jgi:glycosyltransferase involved in cell wall biosynthesis
MNAVLSEGVTIVFPEIKISGGTKSFVRNFLRGIDSTGLQYRTIPIKKLEFSIAGKPRFGFLSQFISSSLKFSDTRITHSLSPSTIIRGTNVVTVHDVLPLIHKNLYLNSFIKRESFKLNLKRIMQTRYLLLSSFTGKKKIIEFTGIDEERIFVVPHAIDHNSFYPTKDRPKFREKKINVVMVSDFNPRKRIDIAIKALSNDPEIDFYHIGPENSWTERMNELKRLSKDAENIHLIGELDPPSLRSYISNADFFLFLTENEGFGLPPLEALACGTNVIASDIEIFHETMNGEANFVRNEDFSADTVMQLLNRRKSREELIQFSKKFSVENLGKNTLNVYKKILGEN